MTRQALGFDGERASRENVTPWWGLRSGVWGDGRRRRPKAPNVELEARINREAAAVAEIVELEGVAARRVKGERTGRATRV